MIKALVTGAVLRHWGEIPRLLAARGYDLILCARREGACGARCRTAHRVPCDRGGYRG